MRRALFLVALVSVVAAAADKPKPQAAPAAVAGVASCDAISGMSTCVEFDSEAKATKACGSFKGTVKKAPCPTAGLVGNCKMPEDDVNPGAIRKYYSTGGLPVDAAWAKNHCKNSMGGTSL